MRRACLLLALSSALACGVGGPPPGGPGLPGGPPPPPRGTPTARSKSLVIGPEGGLLSAPTSTTSGSLTVVVPTGAVAAATDFTVVELTGSPPAGLAGSAWLVGPADATLALPVTLVFTPPAGVAVAEVAAARQDATGYWFREYGVVRDTSDPDPARHTLSLQTRSLGSWALVTLAAQQDLLGPFRLDSTQDAFSAAGTSTLQYLGTDGLFLLYATTGSIELLQPVPNDGSGLACAPRAATTPALLPVPLGIAELQPGMKFRWGINGRWDLDCSDGSHPFVSTNFDTLGLTNLGCDRRYTAAMAASFTGTHVSGQYQIDCLERGKVTAAWDLVPPAGTPVPLPGP